MAAHAPRRAYLDTLRGVAVLVMMEAHVIDSWTRAVDRPSRAFGESLILGGFGAPLFLFLAGVAVPLSAGSKERRIGDAAVAWRMVARRGFEIFLLAFLFRLQSLILSWAAPWTLLKVDILNIMGPSIMLAACVWGICRGLRQRVVVLTALTAALVWMTPLLRAWVPLAHLPDPLAAYFAPAGGYSTFTFFPWMAFVTAGAIAGVFIDAARTAAADRQVTVTAGVGGLVMAALAYQASFLPALTAQSRYWTTSASFFFLRLGLMTASIGAAWLWAQRPWAARAWGPLELLGRHSLFIYWIHVEMVYGLMSLPLHGAFSLGGAWVGLGLFTALMVAAATAKSRFDDKRLSKSRLSAKLDRPVQAL